MNTTRMNNRNCRNSASPLRGVRLLALVIALCFFSLPTYYYAHRLSHTDYSTRELVAPSVVTKTADADVASPTPNEKKVKASSNNFFSVVKNFRIEDLKLNTTQKEKPLIVVVVCTRSSKDWQTVHHTSLYEKLLPSVVQTVTNEELQHFRVEFLVGFDKGEDAFWELKQNRLDLTNSVEFPINFVSVPKTRPHHIPFNEVCRAAYDYGADYICRVNDDTEFTTPQWITRAVATLQGYHPPNLGVVGPACAEGNTQILTHDMVHRTHLDIFQDYYPNEFDNWWIDDWITKVYGKSRTSKIEDWNVTHHINKHGTRYEVQGSQQSLLWKVLQRGKKEIADYLDGKRADHYPVLGTTRVHLVEGPIAAVDNATAQLLEDRNKKLVIRDQSALGKDTQMGWDQVESILKVLPEHNGNLLVWGLGNDSPFWDGTTSGTVVFLEDGDWNVNLKNGQRWFDEMTQKYPQLQAYTIDYKTKNTKEHYERYINSAVHWNELNLTDQLADIIKNTTWDVILVDAPLGCCNMGPGRYQSLYQTKLLVDQQLLQNASKQIHVFVDDYERKIERNFSKVLFEKEPVAVTTRQGETPNQQAHFVFGGGDDNGYKEVISSNDDKDEVPPSSTKKPGLVPWSEPTKQAPNSPMSQPDSWIILLEVNDGYFDFFTNWFQHYTVLNISIEVVIIAEDNTVMEKLQQHVHDKNNSLVTVQRSALQLANVEAFNYETKDYNRLVSARATHVLQYLQQGKNVLYTDVDTVWRSSPLPYLAATDRADLIAQVDNPDYLGMSPYYCTGFMAVVSSDVAMDFFTKWQTALRTPKLNQPVFNQLLHSASSTVAHQPLPSLEFPSGKMYFDDYSGEQREAAVLVHNNYIQGHDAKVQRFEKHGLWKIVNATTAE